jgi:chromosome segregation ATPase
VSDFNRFVAVEQETPPSEDVMRLIRRSLIALLLFIPAVVSAQTIGDQINAATDELKEAIVKRSELQTAKKSIDQTEDDINFGVAAYKKHKSSYKQDMEKYEQATASYRSAVAQHNEHQCVAPADNPGACAAYNAEANELNTRKASLEKEGGSLDTTAKLLEELRSTLANKVDKWAADKKRNNYESSLNEANIESMEKTLAAMRREYEKCKDSIKNGSLEEMHAICGAPFDGNRP